MKQINIINRRKISYLVGILILIVIGVSLMIPQSNNLHANGPSNIGHEKLKCVHCHKEEIGTIRQRLQANVSYLLGQRDNSVSFGLKPVANSECVYCHERPNDRHPVYRFFEPKYTKIQKQIQPQFCISCHLEHKGKRVTSKIGFCQNCHEELILKKDPITKSHQDIIVDKDWASCLGCHDYHGNHRMKVNKKYQNRISKNTITEYFNYKNSPYSESKIHKVAIEKLGG